MKEKTNQPQGDDPATAAGKIQLQIEQMKQQTIKEKNMQDLKVKQAELVQKDQHKQLDLQNQRMIEAAKLNMKTGDDVIKAGVQQEKAAQEREAHQFHMAENAAENGDRAPEGAGQHGKPPDEGQRHGATRQ